MERSDLSQTAGAARCVEVWRLKNVSKCGAGGHHKIANQLRLSIELIRKVRKMINIENLLQICVQNNASDLHLTVGKPPTLRVDNVLMPLNYALLTREDTEHLVKSITSSDHQHKINEFGGVDFGFAFEKVARFRVSIYKQKGLHGLALRLIPSRLLSFE
ncbi:MAG: hypothetical protein DRP78_05200, partial [Candidatus Omnitrophota bacterium]